MFTTKIQKLILCLAVLVALFLPNYTYAASESQPFYRINSGDVDQRQYDLVIGNCTKAIILNPKDDSAYYSRGLIRYKGLQYDLAIADYTKAIELNSQNADYFYNRGNSYLQNKKNDLAIADYNKAIELNSQHQACYIWRGDAYKGKRNDLAMDDYNRVLKMNPSNIGAYEGKRCLLKQYGSNYPCEDSNIRDTSYNPFRH